MRVFFFIFQLTNSMFLYILNKHIRGVAQFGSAFGSGPKGRKFKSCHSDHNGSFTKVNEPFSYIRLRAFEDLFYVAFRISGKYH